MFTFFLRLSRYLAYAGGAVLTALIVLTCVSILGRELNSVFHLDWMQDNLPGLSDWMLDVAGVNEIRGSYELTESGMAFVIFAFLPLTQITAGHAIVDILTAGMKPGVQRVLKMIAEILFAAALVLIAVQLFQGMLSKKSTGQTTLFLQYPVWWSYAASVFAAAVAALVGIYMAAIRIQETVAGRDILPVETGAEH